jgi:hypothetical protein
MSFLTIVIVLFVFILAALLGIGIAFLLMRPTGRKLLHKNTPTQVVTFFMVSLILFSLIFGASTLYRASAYYRVVQDQFDNAEGVIQAGSVIAKYADAWKNNRASITKEIWLQQMMLPNSDSRCFTGDPSICDLFSNVGISVASRWNSYPVFLGLGLTGVLAFLFYSGWILKLKYEEENTKEKELRTRPRSKARR